MNSEITRQSYILACICIFCYCQSTHMHHFSPPPPPPPLFLRKRLRSVCTEELPWRAQANLVYASCYLNQVLGRLRSEKSESIEESLQGGKLPRNGLGFESVGLIIDGVIPSFPEAMAGMGRKVPAQVWNYCGVDPIGLYHN